MSKNNLYSLYVLNHAVLGGKAIICSAYFYLTSAHRSEGSCFHPSRPRWSVVRRFFVAAVALAAVVGRFLELPGQRFAGGFQLGDPRLLPVDRLVQFVEQVLLVRELDFDVD